MTPWARAMMRSTQAFSHGLFFLAGVFLNTVSPLASDCTLTAPHRLTQLRGVCVCCRTPHVAGTQPDPDQRIRAECRPLAGTGGCSSAPLGRGPRVPQVSSPCRMRGV